MIRVEPATRERSADVAVLFEGAIDYARSNGAPMLEAYPIDPKGRLDVAFSYVGFTPMFESAGFETVPETAARSAGRPRWLMRLDLAR